MTAGPSFNKTVRSKTWGEPGVIFTLPDHAVSAEPWTSVSRRIHSGSETLPGLRPIFSRQPQSQKSVSGWVILTLINIDGSREDF